MKKGHLIAVGIYAVVLTFLGVRKFIPSWYAIGWKSDIGTWAMYPFEVTREVSCRIEQANDVRVLDDEKFLWHGTLGSSAHANVPESVVERFASFLAEKHRNSTGTLIVEISLFKNGEPWQKFQVTKSLGQ